jgi:hypothetical protein
MYTCNVSNVIRSIPHDVIQHQGPTAAISIFPWRGIIKAVTHPSTDCPDVAALLYSNRGNRCFNIVRPLALEFGLLRMVGQPSADTHVIWVARHKVTRPQTIFKFRPPSSLDYRTRHGSQSPMQMAHKPKLPDWVDGPWSCQFPSNSNVQQSWAELTALYRNH